MRTRTRPRAYPAAIARTPRIALLVDASGEVSETFVAEEARALRALGAEVTVVAHHPPRAPDPAVPPADLVLSAVPAGRRVAALVRLAARRPLGVVRDVAARRRWRDGGDQPLPLRTLAPLAAVPAAHMHAHFAAGAALSALRVARLTGRPFSVTLHGYDIFLRDMNRGEKLAAAAFATSGSDYTVGELRRHHADSAPRIHRIVMGVDAERWRRTSPEREDGLVVSVGRLVPKKGFAHLLDAVALLRNEPAFGRLVIVGDGPLRDDLDARRRALGLEEVVELVGALPSAEVRSLAERASVVAIPSVIAEDGDRDSMPVIAKEALALEVPVVASAVCGLPEVVTPEWGALAPPGDPAALATALSAELRRPSQERAARGAAGRVFVETHANLMDETARLLARIEAEGP